MVWERYLWTWQWKSEPFVTWEESPPEVDFRGAVYDGIRTYLVNLVGHEGITGVSLRDVTTEVVWETTPFGAGVWSHKAKGKTVTTFDLDEHSPMDPMTLLGLIVVLMIVGILSLVAVYLKKPIESVANAVEYVGKAMYEVAKAAPSAVGLGLLVLAVALLLAVAPLPKLKPKPKGEKE